MKRSLVVLLTVAAVLLGRGQAADAQVVNEGANLTGASAQGSLICLTEPMLLPLSTPANPLTADVALTYFDNSLSTINFGVGTVGQYTIYALGERMTLPAASGFVDSLTLTLSAAAGDSVVVALFPDTLYANAFHLINIIDPNALPYAAGWVPAAAVSGATTVTLHFPHVPVPKEFFVVVSANVHTTLHTITSTFNEVGDRKPLRARSKANSRSAFLAFVGASPTTSLFDSTFLDGSSQPIISDFYVTTYVSTGKGSVAIGSGVENGMSVFPNPASSTLSVSVPEGTEAGRVELRDMLGKLALQSSTSAHEPLNVSQLAPGRYEAILRTPLGTRSAPVVIAR